MKDIKAVILDWAGTSVDFGCMGPARVFVEVFRRWNLDLTLAQARLPMGLAKRDHTRVLLDLPEIKEQWLSIYGELPSENDIDQLYASLEPVMTDIIKDFATPIHGLRGLMDKLHAENIKVGSTTGYVTSMMEKLIPIAREEGFEPDSIVTSSEVPAGRPAPYMCYQNALKMQVFPFSQMVKIGDTIADIQEGLNAGMWTIGLTLSGNEVGMSWSEVSEADPIVISNLVSKAEEKLLSAGAHYIADGIWDCIPILEEINSRILAGELPHVISNKTQTILY
jgi:phosphonoacetaldehyde hydrolase